jgi:hypothetical protein
MGKLKNLATDFVVLPDTQELYRRKCADLTAAKQKLDAIIARQLKIEENPQRQSRDTDAIVVEKRTARALVERLAHEAGLVKQQLIDARPKPPLSPAQQSWADAFSFQPQAGRWQPGTREEIAAATAEVDALTAKAREAKYSGSASVEEAVIRDLRAAKVKVVALQGPPAPPFTRWLSKDDLTAALKKRGVV